MTEAKTADTRHTFAEDVYAILIGSSFSAFGVVLLHMGGLVTGGIAGLALIGTYLTGIPVGVLFFLLNLPFLILAQRLLGWKVAIRSAVTAALLSAITLLVPKWLHVSSIDPLFAAVFGGTLIGMGILSLARHKASVGGIGVLALYLHEKRGINAGKVQGISDIIIVMAAIVALDVRHVLLSVASAVALSLVLLAYHKPGRYTGF